ncbi:hypothetical protein EVAR_44116_1 [Eumeta japonica]|uniref:Uncharacterized protein n=1 Tax=Eumeta variegata TaxID=151549 RepID=A0A4C1ZY65_EUMVA|nr:hypothetical protein EVAR_44116_1 [Eumeta japonica]
MLHTPPFFAGKPGSRSDFPRDRRPGRCFHGNVKEKTANLKIRLIRSPPSDDKDPAGVGRRKSLKYGFLSIVDDDYIVENSIDKSVFSTNKCRRRPRRRSNIHVLTMALCNPLSAEWHGRCLVTLIKKNGKSCRLVTFAVMILANKK